MVSVVESTHRQTVLAREVVSSEYHLSHLVYVIPDTTAHGGLGL